MGAAKLSRRARAAMPQDPAMRKSSPSACVAFIVPPPSAWGLRRVEGGEDDGGEPVHHFLLGQPELLAEQVVHPLKHHQEGERGEFRVLVKAALAVRGPLGG